MASCTCNILVVKTRLYYKRDDFSFPLVNFPFLCNNIPTWAPAYGVYITQLIRYSRACICYHDFLDRVLLFTRNILNQEFQMVKLKSSLRKFYGYQHELVDHYGISLVSQMLSDTFLMLLLPTRSPLTNVTYRIRLITRFVLPWATRRVPHVEQDLLTLSEHLR